MEIIEQRIIRLLRCKLPVSLMHNVDEIEFLILQNKYREAYLKMYEVKKWKNYGGIMPIK